MDIGTVYPFMIEREPCLQALKLCVLCSGCTEQLNGGQKSSGQGCLVSGEGRLASLYHTPGTTTTGRLTKVILQLGSI